MKNPTYDSNQIGRGVIWQGPFRIFFVLCSLAAVWPVLAWTLLLTAEVPLPAGFSPGWHAHELLFGMVPAAAVGFLLTAIPHWTGCEPFRGRVLYGLAALWLGGRIAMLFSAQLPAALVAGIDGLFLPVFAVLAARPIIAAKAWRNLLIVLVLLLWSAANGMMHAGWLGYWPAGVWRGERLALDLLQLLMVIIAGRITPAFSRNWLQRNQGRIEDIQDPAPLRGLSLIALVVLTLAMQLAVGAPGDVWLAVGAAMVAVLLGVRWWFWRGWRILREPLLWILHLGWLWMIGSLALRAGAIMGWWPPSLWIHALSAGAMGTLIIAVMTRVALGHSGRPLQLPRGGVVIYWLILFAGGLRVIAAAGGINLSIFGMPYQVMLLIIATVAWAGAFIGYLWLYWPVLTRPRVDGLPG